jgi:hypothetical protein
MRQTVTAGPGASNGAMVNLADSCGAPIKKL